MVSGVRDDDIVTRVNTHGKGPVEHPSYGSLMFTFLTKIVIRRKDENKFIIDMKAGCITGTAAKMWNMLSFYYISIYWA